MNDLSVWEAGSDRIKIKKAAAKKRRAEAAAKKLTDKAAAEKLKAAYKRYLGARCMPTPDGEYSPAAVGEMQAAMLDALLSGAPLPDEMRLHLCLAFEYLREGLEFDLVMPAQRRGGREPLIAKKTQEEAIRYLRWCDEGRIADSSPPSTVGTAYGVSTRTVLNWRKGWGDKPTPSLLPMGHYGEVDQDAEASLVGKLMRSGGKQYQRFKPKAKEKRKA